MDGDAELQDLYREVLLDYFRSSAHKGKLAKPGFRSHGINPVCGDEIELTMDLDGPRIARIRYDGHGCVISQASSAMMAESLEGRAMSEAGRLVAAFKTMMVSQGPVDALPEELEALKALEGVRRFPLRVKCATLAWNTLQKGLEQPGRGAGEFREVG